MGDFFAALPDVLVAVWEFGEGLRSVLIAAGSAVLAVGFLFLARRLREEHGWMSAVFGVMGGTVVLWWLFGIIPSSFIYFWDGETELLAGRVVPEALPGMSNAYEVLRDLVVVGETVVALLVCGIASLMIQKRYPRTLAEGEEKGPSSGGYK